MNHQYPVHCAPALVVPPSPPPPAAALMSRWSSLSSSTPVTDYLPDIEERGMYAVDLRAIREHWPHFCPRRRPISQTKVRRRRSRKDSSDRRPYLKEFSCACGSILRCQHLADDGTIVFTLVHPHDGTTATATAPFVVTVRGSGASKAGVRSPVVPLPPIFPTATSSPNLPPLPPLPPGQPPIPPPEHPHLQTLLQSVQQLQRQLNYQQVQIQQLQQQQQQPPAALPPTVGLSPLLCMVFLPPQPLPTPLLLQLPQCHPQPEPQPHAPVQGSWTSVEPSGPPNRNTRDAERHGPTLEARRRHEDLVVVGGRSGGGGGGDRRKDAADESEHDNVTVSVDVEDCAKINPGGESESGDSGDDEAEMEGRPIDERCVAVALKGDGDDDGDDDADDAEATKDMYNGAEGTNNELASLPFSGLPFVLPSRHADGLAEDDGSSHTKRCKTNDDSSPSNAAAVSPTTTTSEPTFDEVRDRVVEAFTSDDVMMHFVEVTSSKANDKFITSIVGNRFQVSLELGSCREFYKILRNHKPCVEWLNSVHKSVEWVRRRLLRELDTYVLEKDTTLASLRRSRGGAEYMRHAASLLISYGRVSAQSWHIDMQFPLYQAVLLLTSSPPTDVAPVQDVLEMQSAILQVEAFVNMLCQRLSPAVVNAAVKKDMVQAIRADPNCVDLVERYGWLVTSLNDKQKAHNKAVDCMPEPDGGAFRGYMGFPGSVIHRGPPCSQTRIALFAAYGQESDVPYDPTTQTAAPSFYVQLSDMIVDRLKTKKAKTALWKVGEALLLEEKVRAVDVYQYDGAADVVRGRCPSNVSELSEGLLVAMAQARSVQKSRRINVDYDLASRDRKAFYDKYISTRKKRRRQT